MLCYHGNSGYAGSLKLFSRYINYNIISHCELEIAFFGKQCHFKIDYTILKIFENNRTKDDIEHAVSQHVPYRHSLDYFHR